MTVEELIGALSPSEKLQAFEILRRELAKEQEELTPPEWHSEVLASRRENPDPAPSLPVNEAFEKIWAKYHARET